MILAGVEADRARAEADLEATEREINGLAHEIAALLPAPLPAGRDRSASSKAGGRSGTRRWRWSTRSGANEAAFHRLAEDAERARRALSLRPLARPPSPTTPTTRRNA